MRRNTCTFENKFEDPKTIMYRATTQLEDNHNSNVSVTRGLPSQPTIAATKKWIPPMANSIKANQDAALTSQYAITGLGGIFRDSNREILASFCNIHPLVTCPTLTEALALRKCMQICLDLGFNNIAFEGGCKDLVYLLFYNQIRHCSKPCDV